MSRLSTDILEIYR